MPAKLCGVCGIASFVKLTASENNTGKAVQACDCCYCNNRYFNFVPVAYTVDLH